MAKKILLIEDDLDIQRIYREKLTGAGFEVILASDAPNGLTAIKGGGVNLILLDIMLPGTMNGFELLEIIKKDSKFGSTPIIIMTNLDTEYGQAEKLGVSDYLIKANTSLADLVEKVKKLT